MARVAYVTGAGGFIGSHLVEALLSHGWELRALVRYNSRGSLGWLAPCYAESQRTGGKLTVVAGDVRDQRAVMESMRGAEVVFHLAALVGIPYSYHAPASYVETNIAGTLNVLEAARQLKVRRLVHTSSSEVYGTPRETPVREDHPQHAQSPYAATKIAADKIVESYVCSYDLPAVTLRPFNTYGPRQSARAVIPSIISQALESKRVRLGSLHPVRDFTFVTDTVDGFIRAAEAEGVIGETIQLGTGEAAAIGELAKQVFELLGITPEIVTEERRVRPAGSEVERLISSNAKAQKLLGWSPSVPLQVGLLRTIEWIRDHRVEYRVGEYTI